MTMKLFSGNSQNVIGLDIGSSSIKLAQLVATREGIALRKAGSTLTPPEAVKNGVIVDPLGISQAISSLLEALQVEAGIAVGGVAGPAVVVRQVALPVMSPKQLRQSVVWEARNYISFPVEDSILESQIISRPESPSSGNMMDVMLVAAPREMVESCAETIEMSGLEPVAVEVQSFAAMRALIDLAPDQENATLALVGIGASFSEITIVKGGNFVLSRVIPIAGNSFTDAIRTSLEIGREEALMLKETALRVVLDEEERAALDPAAQQASRAVEPLLEELIREVRRSLAYHDYQQKLGDAGAKGKGADKIILSGGSAKLAGLDRYLQHQLGIPTALASLPALVGLGDNSDNAGFLKEHAPTLVIAAGLALREMHAWRAKARHAGPKAAPEETAQTAVGDGADKAVAASGGKVG
jgi:type IV pilus assembly protein PilM